MKFKGRSLAWVPTGEFEEGRKNLNPRSHAVKNLEMAIRRGHHLHQVLSRHLELCHGDPLIAKSESPYGHGDSQIRKSLGELDLYRWTQPLDEYGLVDNPTWRLVFDMWYSGNNYRNMKRLYDQLPDASRRKVQQETGWFQ